MMIRALAIVTALALPTIALADEPQPPMDKAKPTDKMPDKTTDKSTDKTKAGKLAEGDMKIISHLHHVNQMEIDLGKIAQRNGTPTVKNYAETLEKDHQSADKDLVSFAKQHKLNVIPMDKPDSEAGKQEEKEMTQKVAHMKGLKGAEFDREFLTMMVTGHEKELSRIDMSITAANDPDLQTMLKSVKPVLQRHADQARDLTKSPQASNLPIDKPADKPSDKPTDKPLPSQR
jgi:putative membrane protein